MKSILIIGMSRFGRHLATKLSELGNEVMIVDQNELIINKLASDFTDAYSGDCTSENVIKELDIKNFDVCFVTIGDNFQSSLEITALLKENGAKHIIAKASLDTQAKFLKQIGADEVVYPDKDMAERIAIKTSYSNVFGYIPVNKEYAIYETTVLPEWVDKTIEEINVRKNYHVNVVAINKSNNFVATADANYKFEAGDHIIFIGKNADAVKLTKE